MQTYIGHHTCSMGGGYKFVMQNSPFLSEWPKEEDDDPRTPYLGEGYYFWQQDLVQAKKWGKKFYSSWFYVIEANINTTDSNFLDFIGNPFQANMFLLGCAKLVSDGAIDRDFTIGEAIEYLKKAAKNSPGLFPWLVIRGRDDNVSQKKVYFRKVGNSHMYFGGNFIFCLVEKNDVILTNKKIVFQSQFQQ